MRYFSTIGGKAELKSGGKRGSHMQIGMIEDRIVRLEELSASYLDRGIYFGDGIYEVMRSYGGKIFAIEEHLERFANGLSAIGIDGVERSEVRRRVEKAFEAAGIENARIYFHITRGSEVRSHLPRAELKPNFFLTVTELGDESLRPNGIAVSVYPDIRWKRCDIKSLNLLANVLARIDAEKKGCEEAILVDDNGFITEGAGSSFFAVVRGLLRTARLSANILPSVTRGYVLKAARKSGIETVEQSLKVQEARTADELFIAVTTKDIVPVVRFDDTAIGNGRPGKYTTQLIQEFKAFTA
ncbi:MAG: aminotransferase class IV [Sedimentisphaerales bacterium]|nr:aminotransferase class IV [Sedimentisphaerales bacterium]